MNNRSKRYAGAWVVGVLLGLAGCGGAAVEESDGESVDETESAVSANLLTNGGFESNLSGWSLFSGKWPTIKTTAKHSGAKGARFTTTSDEWAILSRDLHVVAGTKFTLSYYTRRHSGGGHTAQLTFWDDGGSYVDPGGEYITPVSSSTSWTKGSVSGIAPDRAHTMHINIGEFDDRAAVYDWDDIQLTQCIPVGTSCSASVGCCPGLSCKYWGSSLVCAD